MSANSAKSDFQPLEAQATRASLEIPIDLTYLSSPDLTARQFDISTAAEADRIASQFFYVGLPVIERTSTRWLWGLGLPAPGYSDTASATIIDNGERRTVVCEVSAPDHKETLSDHVAHCGGVRFRGRLVAFIQMIDPEAQETVNESVAGSSPPGGST